MIGRQHSVDESVFLFAFLKSSGSTMTDLGTGEHCFEVQRIYLSCAETLGST